VLANPRVLDLRRKRRGEFTEPAADPAAGSRSFAGARSAAAISAAAVGDEQNGRSDCVVDQHWSFSTVIALPP